MSSEIKVRMVGPDHKRSLRRQELSIEVPPRLKRGIKVTLFTILTAACHLPNRNVPELNPPVSAPPMIYTPRISTGVIPVFSESQLRSEIAARDNLTTTDAKITQTIASIPTQDFPPKLSAFEIREQKTAEVRKKLEIEYGLDSNKATAIADNLEDVIKEKKYKGQMALSGVAEAVIRTDGLSQVGEKLFLPPSSYLALEILESELIDVHPISILTEEERHFMPEGLFLVFNQGGPNITYDYVDGQHHGGIWITRLQNNSTIDKILIGSNRDGEYYDIVNRMGMEPNSIGLPVKHMEESSKSTSFSANPDHSLIDPLTDINKLPNSGDGSGEKKSPTPEIDSKTNHNSHIINDIHNEKPINTDVAQNPGITVTSLDRNLQGSINNVIPDLEVKVSPQATPITEGKTGADKSIIPALATASATATPHLQSPLESQVMLVQPTHSEPVDIVINLKNNFPAVQPLSTPDLAQISITSVEGPEHQNTSTQSRPVEAPVLNITVAGTPNSIPAELPQVVVLAPNHSEKIDIPEAQILVLSLAESVPSATPAAPSTTPILNSTPAGTSIPVSTVSKPENNNSSVRSSTSKPAESNAATVVALATPGTKVETGSLSSETSTVVSSPPPEPTMPPSTPKAVITPAIINTASTGSEDQKDPPTKIPTAPPAATATPAPAQKPVKVEQTRVPAAKKSATKIPEKKSTPAPTSSPVPTSKAANPNSDQVVVGTPDKYKQIIVNAAKKNNISPMLVSALIQAESEFDPNAVSNEGAVGLTQLMPGTAKGLGVTDRRDPKQSIEGGAKYLADMKVQFNGNESLAIAAFNAGPGNVQKGNVPPETKAYVKKVQSLAGHVEKKK